LYVHHNTASMPVYQGNRPITAQKAALASVVFDYYEGLASQVSVIEGTLSVPARLPGGEIPIALSFSTARSLHSRIGSPLQISKTGHRALGPPLVVAAIYVPRDPRSAFWGDTADNEGYSSVVVPRLDDFLTLQNLPADLPPQFFWRVRTNVQLIRLDTSQQL